VPDDGAAGGLASSKFGKTGCWFIEHAPARAVPEDRCGGVRQNRQHPERALCILYASQTL
jgi:hypothetical protein